MRRGLVEAARVDVGHHDTHPLGDEPPRQREADAAGCAGNDRRPPGERVHQMPAPAGSATRRLGRREGEDERGREPAGIRLREDAARVGARREQARDRLPAFVQDARAVVDREPGEGERDRGHGLDHVERWPVDGHGVEASRRVVAAFHALPVEVEQRAAHGLAVVAPFRGEVRQLVDALRDRAPAPRWNATSNVSRGWTPST